jgi:hypothetical protein
VTRQPSIGKVTMLRVNMVARRCLQGQLLLLISQCRTRRWRSQIGYAENGTVRVRDANGARHRYSGDTSSGIASFTIRTSYVAHCIGAPAMHDGPRSGDSLL